MLASPLLSLLIVMVAGVALATQTPINAALSRSLASPVGATAVSFGVGLIVLIGITLVTSGPQIFARLGSTPGWQLLGGFFGAFYVCAALWGVSTLGVLSTMAALILGQMGAALVLDGWGLFGLQVQALSVWRIAAAGLVAAGLVLSRI
jgi:bacterial/archaeal transporter family-2 protein